MLAEVSLLKFVVVRPLLAGNMVCGKTESTGCWKTDQSAGVLAGGLAG